LDKFQITAVATAMQQDFIDGSILKNMSAAVFHIGDISYARGFATLWEQFFYQISNMSTSVPWMTWSVTSSHTGLRGIRCLAIVLTAACI
jgi:hypothetical protein